MKCGVVVVRDLNQSGAYELCLTSIQLAIANDMGPFESVEIISLDSCEICPNEEVVQAVAIKRAIASGCDWVIFLRANEFIFVEAFRAIAHLVDEYDAIWGFLVEAADSDLLEVKILENNYRQTNTVANFVSPSISSLKAGFFIRTKLSTFHEFDPTVETKNETIFLLNLWKRYKCIKGDFIITISINNQNCLASGADEGIIPKYTEIDHLHISEGLIRSIEVDTPEVVKRFHSILFTVGTLVNNKNEYDQMLKSFEMKGFNNENSEFIYVDNSEVNKLDAFKGLNCVINAARGEYIILCHQDIRLHADNIINLTEKLEQLNAIDPDWALAGNAGGVGEGFKPVRISDPYGTDRSVGVFPVKVSSLDENFIVLKKRARVSFSNNLKGFHFYGTDICINAGLLGYNAYVIDFHLKHLSGGKIDELFFDKKKEFEWKWRNALGSKTIQTSCTIVDIEPPVDMGNSTLFSKPKHRVFQIFYDDDSKSRCASEFIPFDNSENLRPDWFEFWPIRNFLKNSDLEENCFYGFLSPSFCEKTKFSASEVVDTLTCIDAHVDVVLMTHAAPDLVLHPNPFWQGEAWHPGLLSTCELFLSHIGNPLNLRSLITTLHNSVFSNYIVAKPIFWLKWLSMADLLFDCAESSSGELADLLNQSTMYKNEKKIQMKVFIQERIATIVLNQLNVKVFVPSFFQKLKMCDNEERAFLVYMENLKMAYNETQDMRFLYEYEDTMKSLTIKAEHSVHDLTHVLRRQSFES